jgi:outer membrane lipoprotein carrier protein
VTSLALWVCLPALALPFSAAAAGPDLWDALHAVEKRYNNARTLEVRFEQTYEVQRRGPKTESGQLFLRKPGRMRWQYTEPAGKLFISDGKYIFLYTPASNRVERSKVKESDDIRAPLAFLLGQVDFQRDFKRFITRRNGSEMSITAEPKSDRAPYSQVEFRLGPGFEIRELQVTGQDNSTMSFRFSGEQVNPPLSDKLFQFQPPPGAEFVDEGP